jgi:hypothetical protein
MDKSCFRNFCAGKDNKKKGCPLQGSIDDLRGMKELLFGKDINNSKRI